LPPLSVGHQVTIQGFKPEKSLKPNILTYVENTHFIENSQRNRVSSFEELLGYMKNQGLTKTFGENMQRIYGVGLNWEFTPSLDDPKEYRAATMVNDKPYYLSGLGDGFRFAASILAFAICNKNTALMIEEIECNQHPSALKAILKTLVKLCLEQNIQLFLTTHSKEVEDTLLLDIFGEDPDQRETVFRSFLVSRNSENGVVVCKRVKTEENAADWAKVNETLWS
jgi:hypothetical protein